MYEYMAEFKAVHVMQLPNSASDAARAHCGKRRSCALQQVIEARFGTLISEAGAARSHRVENRERWRWLHFIVSGSSIRWRSAAATS